MDHKLGSANWIFELRVRSAARTYHFRAVQLGAVRQFCGAPMWKKAWFVVLHKRIASNLFAYTNLENGRPLLLQAVPKEAIRIFQRDDIRRKSRLRFLHETSRKHIILVARYLRHLVLVLANVAEKLPNPATWRLLDENAVVLE